MSINYDCNTTQSLKNFIKTYDVVVLKLGAEWCAPCKSIIPAYTQLSVTTIANINKLKENSPSIIFISIDIDDTCTDTGQKWGEHLQCNGVPMFIVFSSGKTNDSFMGGDLNPVMDCIDSALNQLLNTTSVQSLS